MVMEYEGPALDELLRMAREDIARNSLTSAEKVLEQAILLNNQSSDAYYQLGCVYSKKGKFKKAMMAFERALNLEPTHTEAAIALSSLYNDVGKYREGASVFLRTKKRLESSAPGYDPKINQSLAGKHYDLGMLYLRYDRFDEAHREFAKALQLEPQNIKCSVQVAKCLARTGDKDSALKFLRSALETNPRCPEIKVQLGILYHSQKLFRDAKREWQEALSLEPGNKQAQMYLSMFDYEPHLTSQTDSSGSWTSHTWKTPTEKNAVDKNYFS